METNEKGNGFNGFQLDYEKIRKISKNQFKSEKSV